MTGYVVTLVYEVGECVAAAHARSVMAGWWGAGQEFALLDGAVLTLVAELEAPDRGDAFEAVLVRAELAWSSRTASALPPPRTARVEAIAPPPPPPLYGAVGRGPDRVLAEGLAGRLARLHAVRAALLELDLTDLTEAEALN